MKKNVLSLLTGAALLGSVGVASAAELMVLPNAAMDGITAGTLARPIAALSLRMPPRPRPRALPVQPLQVALSLRAQQIPLPSISLMPRPLVPLVVI